MEKEEMVDAEKVNIERAKDLQTNKMRLWDY